MTGLKRLFPLDVAIGGLIGLLAAFLTLRHILPRGSAASDAYDSPVDFLRGFPARDVAFTVAVLGWFVWLCVQSDRQKVGWVRRCIALPLVGGVTLTGLGVCFNWWHCSTLLDLRALLAWLAPPPALWFLAIAPVALWVVHRTGLAHLPSLDGLEPAAVGRWVVRAAVVAGIAGLAVFYVMSDTMNPEGKIELPATWMELTPYLSTGLYSLLMVAVFVALGICLGCAVTALKGQPVSVALLACFLALPPAYTLGLADYFRLGYSHAEVRSVAPECFVIISDTGLSDGLSRTLDQRLVTLPSDSIPSTFLDQPLLTQTTVDVTNAALDWRARDGLAALAHLARLAPDSLSRLLDSYELGQLGALLAESGVKPEDELYATLSQAGGTVLVQSYRTALQNPMEHIHGRLVIDREPAGGVALCNGYNVYAMTLERLAGHTVTELSNAVYVLASVGPCTRTKPDGSFDFYAPPGPLVVRLPRATRASVSYHDVSSPTDNNYGDIKITRNTTEPQRLVVP